jgi:pyridoxine 5-phosphate synthase
MASLCVNIDHVATVRQARREAEPDPVLAVGPVENAGSTGVTVHLREDQRHISERDVRLIRQVARGHLNLEMAATPGMVAKALDIKPDIATLVPERRQEVTTEGGLDVAGAAAQVGEAVARLQGAGIEASLFIDAEARQVEASVRSGARQVEFHTGPYCLASEAAAVVEQWRRLDEMTRLARQAGLVVNAGHGLNYRNVRPVAAIEGMRELNIGHAIVSRAIFSGLAAAVAEMVALIEDASRHPHLWRLG